MVLPVSASTTIAETFAFASALPREHLVELRLQPFAALRRHPSAASADPPMARGAASRPAAGAGRSWTAALRPRSAPAAARVGRRRSGVGAPRGGGRAARRLRARDRVGRSRATARASRYAWGSWEQRQTTLTPGDRLLLRGVGAALQARWPGPESRNVTRLVRRSACDGRASTSASFPELLASRYRVLASVGRGAIAEVVRARDEQTARRSRSRSSTRTCARARRSSSASGARSRSCAASPHPHVLAIHQVVESDGQLFLVMDYHPGGDLGRPAGAQAALRCGRVRFLAGAAVRRAGGGAPRGRRPPRRQAVERAVRPGRAAGRAAVRLRPGAHRRVLGA